MMAEFVSIPTQRLKARQFVHPDDDSGLSNFTFLRYRYYITLKIVFFLTAF